MISYLHKYFVSYASLGLFTVLIILTCMYVIVILKTENHYVIREMKTAADALLALASLLIVLPSVQYLLSMIEAVRAVAHSGTGDPRTIMGGVAQALWPYILGFSGFIVVYVIWGGLRLLQGRALQRLTQQRQVN